MKTVDQDHALHLMGLLSDGGVHSHNTHLYSLIQMARDLGTKNVFVHAILDGRDVPPRSALSYFGELKERIGQSPDVRVATVSGRYYTMDRDKRWERTALAYSCLVDGAGFSAASPEEAVNSGYQRGENDEFIKPTVIDQNGMIKDGDSVIFFNFRPDRARQITRAFVDKDFSMFPHKMVNVHFVCMTQYDKSLKAEVAFPIVEIKNTLGEVVSRAGMRQLRIAETEKYAHVTYFFNGGVETPFPGEDRALIPSPKVATYDQQPEMSAPLVTEEAVNRIRSKRYDLIILNFANPDMVGHTGIYEAAVKAVETVDRSVGAVVHEILGLGGTALITADHGNAEKMFDESTGQPHTAHTTNPVPFILVSNERASSLRRGGILADVAPTILDLLGQKKPIEMTGKSLLE
jgi:2,3-bisphosphoglycerate-independent phosphoglycerate mutase